MSTPAAGHDMILIPEGPFIMGGPGGDEKPIREVFLDAYRIGKFPVTVGAYRLYCEAQNIDFAKFPRPKWGWLDDHPMVRVTWHEARDYCLWAGGDLPSEAQWEKAARGTNGQLYPWGDEWEPTACHRSRLTAGDALSTAPVDAYPMGASPYGCLDMVGNVWEWCLDWYAESYAGLAARNPTGPNHGVSRVMRGGSWFYRDRKHFRATSRKHLGPQFHNYDRGFRLATAADGCEGSLG